MAHDEFNESFQDEELFPDEHELKKKIQKLNNQLRKVEKEHQTELKRQEKLSKRVIENLIEEHNNSISTLREQLRELLEKNLDLSEACKVFAKGIENLKKDGITVTLSHRWSRKGVEGTIEKRISQLAMDKKRIVAILPMIVSPRGETLEAVIVTEHFEKYKTT